MNYIDLLENSAWMLSVYYYRMEDYRSCLEVQEEYFLWEALV